MSPIAFKIAEGYIQVNVRYDRNKLNRAAGAAGRETGGAFSRGFSRSFSNADLFSKGRISKQFGQQGAQAGRSFAKTFKREAGSGRLFDTSRFGSGVRKEMSRHGRASARSFKHGFIVGTRDFIGGTLRLNPKKFNKQGTAAASQFKHGFARGTRNFIGNDLGINSRQFARHGIGAGQGFKRGFSSGARGLSVPGIDRSVVRVSVRRGRDSGRSFSHSFSRAIARGAGNFAHSFSRWWDAPLSMTKGHLLTMVAVVAAISPIIGGALATGITLAFGGGIAALGLIAAAQSEKVKKRFREVKDTIVSDFRSMAKPLEGTLMDVADDIMKVHKALKGPFRQAFKSMAPILSDFSEHISDAFAGWGPVIRAASRAFNGLMKNLGPIMKVELGHLGDALKELFGVVAANPAPFAAIIGGLIRLVTWGVKVVTFFARAYSGIMSFFLGFAKGPEKATSKMAIFGVVTRRIVNGIVGAFRWLGRTISSVTGWFTRGLGAAVRVVSGWVGSVIRWFRHLWYTLVGGSIVPDMIRGIIRWFAMLPVRAARFVVNLVRRVINGFRNMINTTIRVVSGWWPRMVAAFGALRAGVGRAVNAVRNVVVRIFRGMVRGSTNAVRGLWRGVVRVFAAMRNGVVRIVRGIRNSVVRWFTGARNGSVRVFRGFQRSVSRVFNGIRGAVTRIVRATRNAIVRWFTGARNGSVRVFNGLRKSAGRIFAGIRGVVSRAVRGTRNAIVNWFNRARNASIRIFNSFRKGAGRVWSGIRGVISRAARGARNGVVNWFNRARNASIRIFNSFRKGAQRIWNGIRGALSRIARGIRNNTVNWFNRARNASIRIFNNFRKGATNVWNGIRRNLSNIARRIRNSVVNWFSRARNASIRIFNNFRKGATNIWNGLRKNIGNIARRIRNIAVNWFNRLRNSSQRIFNSFRKSSNNIWNGIRKNISRTVRAISKGVIGTFNKVRVGAVALFNRMKNGIGKVWSRVKSVAKKPVAFVVNTVYNNGLHKMYSAVRKAVPALPKMSKVKLQGFASGGILPGYSPGRDNMYAQGPEGPVHLSGGEAIMRPEWTRAIGAEGVNAMNKAARAGGVRGVQKAMLGKKSSSGGRDRQLLKATATQDPAPVRPVSGFAKGGILSQIGGFLSRKKDDLLTNLTKFAEKPMNALMNFKNKFGKGPLPNMPWYVMKSVSKAVMDLFKEQEMGGGSASDVVNLARKQIGKHPESGGNNTNKITRWYGMNGAPWCAMFISWLFNKAGASPALKKAKRTAWTGDYYTSGMKKVPHSKRMPGDVAVYGTQHVNLVESMKSRIGGNEGNNVRRSGRQGGTIFRPNWAAAGGVGGGGNAVFTSFWDPQTASGVPMNRKTIASSYIPLGTKMRVSIGGKSANGIVQDLGPAKFVYDRHKGKAVFDLNSKMMQSLTGRASNVTTGNWRITKRGSGRTLYGTRWRGYEDGGIMSGSHDIGGMLPDRGVAVNRSGHAELVTTVRQLQGLISAAEKGGAVNVQNVNIHVESMDDVETLKKLLNGIRQTTRANGARNRRTR